MTDLNFVEKGEEDILVIIFIRKRIVRVRIKV